VSAPEWLLADVDGTLVLIVTGDAVDIATPALSETATHMAYRVRRLDITPPSRAATNGHRRAVSIAVAIVLVAIRLVIGAIAIAIVGIVTAIPDTVIAMLAIAMTVIVM